MRFEGVEYFFYKALYIILCIYTNRGLYLIGNCGIKYVGPFKGSPKVTTRRTLEVSRFKGLLCRNWGDLFTEMEYTVPSFVFISV